MTRSRSFGDTDTAALLAAIRTFRDALIQAQRTAPPTGDVYKATGPVLDALGGLAEALTGNREHFHLPMAGAYSDGEGA
jgi:hypothetical protein